jgi:hypothetical protein
MSFVINSPYYYLQFERKAVDPGVMVDECTNGMMVTSVLHSPS